MDHGQFEREGRVMSQAHVDKVDLCDNLPTSQAQTPNLNSLTESRGLPLSQTEGKTCDVITKTSLNNNGKEEQKLEMEQGHKESPEKSRNEYDEEDTDEMMREEEEEDESEGSSCITRGKSPDTPMTDSSYSETGSLLETPYPLSPVASPEPTSPVIPAVNPEAANLIDSPGLRHSDTEAEPTFTVGPVSLTTQSLTSVRSPTQPTEASDGTAKDSSTEQITSSAEPVFSHGPVSTTDPTTSCPGPIISAAETLTLTALAKLNTSTTSTTSTPASAAMEILSFTPGPITADPESRSTTLAVLSNQEQMASTPLTAGVSVSTITAGAASRPALLETLEQLAQRGDDTHLPQYLHQIAEAFFLQEDYQRALWFIQLERLYHQRVLDNLNALQEQWESQCRVTCSSDLATRCLDTLKHICQTHSRPRTRDAENASLDLLRPKSEGHGAWPSCNSDHQVEGRMEQKAEDSLCPVIPSILSPEICSSLEISEKDGENPARESERRGIVYGSPRTEEQSQVGEGGDSGGGGVGCTISVIGNGLHPSPAGAMDQSKSAEQQGDLYQAREEEEKGEVEEAAEALEMEDEGAEDEGEEEQKEGGPDSRQEPLPVETLVSGAEVEPQQLNQNALGQEKQHDESRHCQNPQGSKASLHDEVPPPQEVHIKQRDERGEEREVDEEEDYEVYQADIIREAPSLDDMAKLITIEEISPASGLVSILKKRNAFMDSMSVSSRTELQPDRQTAKRRVRFKVPDDGYDNEVGGGDSCLLLFLLCLVTVVISVGGTALYCAIGDAQSSVCQDFSRNADFYFDQIHRGITQIQHWFAPGS
ncbi:consortin [Cololabis saira]|uniref:consortin n=1 Tax=Cololabis saira TaxID=129043 RepID=UPI002AD46D58|nr:consortin [Cololabis saira]